MTIEKLKEAERLSEKMQELEEFIKAFNRPYLKSVLAHKENCKSIALSIESGDELYKIIDNHLRRQLEDLNRQFEEI